MIHGFRKIVGLTMISRILGMLRDAAFAHFFGANWLMTAWTMGFKIPNLSRRLFGEGAATASFIPIYSEQLHAAPEDASKLASTVICVIAAVLSGIVLVGELVIWAIYAFAETRPGPRLGLALCAIMLPYMVLVFSVAILAGILQVHRRFGPPAAAPIVLNVFVIGGLFFSGWVLKLRPEQQPFFVAFCVVAAGLAQVCLQIPFLRASGVRLRFAWLTHMESFRRVMLLMLPMVVGLTVTQLNTLLDDLTALCFMTEQGHPLGYGSPSYLYYAQRLYQVPLGVLGISLATAIFPVMSANAAQGDTKALAGTIARGLRAVVFTAVPATAGIVLVARPMVSAIFEHGQFSAKDTPLVALTLVFYALGLCGYFAQQIMTRAYYALQDSRTPAMSALVALTANLLLNLALMWRLGTAGLAAATAISAYVQVLFLARGLSRRFDTSVWHGMLPTFLKTVAASAFMLLVGCSLLCLSRFLPLSREFDMIRLVLVVPIGAGCYLFAARKLRAESLSLVFKSKA
jgi:putative peptidoglycan lipid II flippase